MEAHLFVALAVVSIVACDDGRRAPPPPMPPPRANPAPALLAAQGVYTVQGTEGGWYQIAQVNGVTMPDLLAANDATTATPLHPGDVIRLPVVPRTTAPIAPSPARAVPTMTTYGGSAPINPPPRATTTVYGTPSPVPPPITPGNVVICEDGTVSGAGGRQGACSHHGGVQGKPHRHKR